MTINGAGDYVASSPGSPYIGYAPVAGGSATALLTGSVNPRSVAVYNNTLFYTSAANPTGIFMIGAAGALSTAGGQTATLMSTNSSYPNTSPSSFVFQNSSVLWACDDGASGSYGVWRLVGTFGMASSYTGETGESALSFVSSSWLHCALSLASCAQPHRPGPQTGRSRRRPALALQGRSRRRSLPCTL